MLQRVEQQKSTGVSNLITNFFEGESEAWGTVVDRFGNLKKKFTIEMAGSFEEDYVFRLEEKFMFDNGETDNRSWFLTFASDGSFSGTTSEVIGVCNGTSNAEEMRMKYLFNLKIGNRHVPINFDDRMYYIDDETLANRSVMYKFGVRLGEINCIFRKI